ncbi:MAG TPA: hypothetical protein VJP77_02875, partial [Planctomycetota bacterium]|nr:hypothetical protein [Planctomycetota bacterium]
PLARPLALAALATPALAQDPLAAPAPSPWDRYSLSVGGILLGLDSTAQVGTSGVGAVVDLEGVLGLDSTTQALRLEGTWRFTENRRHELSLSWLDLGRSATRQVAEDVVIDDDTTLPAGSTVNSELGIELYRLGYAYSFFQDERIDVSASFGTYIAPIDVAYDAVGVASGQKSFDLTAPLPVFGIDLDVAFTPRVFLRTGLDLFYLKFDGFEGALVDSQVAVEWRPWRRLGIGLGYESFALELERKQGSDVPGVTFEGKVEFDYRGLLLYLKYAA